MIIKPLFFLLCLSTAAVHAAEQTADSADNYNPSRLQRAWDYLWANGPEERRVLEEASAEITKYTSEVKHIRTNGKRLENIINQAIQDKHNARERGRFFQRKDFLLSN